MTRMRINPLRQELQCLDQRAKHQARSVRHITAWILGVLDVLDYVTWALAATKPYSPRIPRRVDGVRPLSDRRSRARNTTALACAVTCLTRPKPHCRPFRRSLRHQWPRSSVARERARSGGRYGPVEQALVPSEGRCCRPPSPPSRGPCQRRTPEPCRLAAAGGRQPCRAPPAPERRFRQPHRLQRIHCEQRSMAPTASNAITSLSENFSAHSACSEAGTASRCQRRTSAPLAARRNVAKPGANRCGKPFLPSGGRDSRAVMAGKS